MEIGKDDEVIVPAYTYTASASIIVHVGAKIKFIDNKKESFKVDYNSIENLITPNTKAIILVDLAGVPADYERLYKIVKESKYKFKPNNKIQEKIGRIAIIADAAHSFGATLEQKSSGNLADFTSFSFHAVKNLTTAEGGAVTWKDIEGINNLNLYNKFKLLALHGQNKDAFEKNECNNWEYDIKIPAYKYNMTDIMASIGLAQFSRYDNMLERRKEIIQMYDKELSNYDIQILQHYNTKLQSSGHLYLVRLIGKDEVYRNRFIEELAKKGIESNVHYKPLPMMTAYKNLGFSIKNFPNSYNTYKNEISLPLHTTLSDEDVEYVIKAFKKTLKEMKCINI